MPFTPEVGSKLLFWSCKIGYMVVCQALPLPLMYCPRVTSAWQDVLAGLQAFVAEVRLESCEHHTTCLSWAPAEEPLNPVPGSPTQACPLSSPL